MEAVDDVSFSAFLGRIDLELVKKHLIVLLPLAGTQLLQRLEHVIDNRFITKLGNGPLLIHSINFNFFLMAQAVGLAAATSALIFWKRRECHDKQRSILSVHVRSVAITVLLIGLGFLPFLGLLIRQYGVESQYEHAALVYLRIGLLNMILVAIYAPLNALLIASDQRVRSMVYIAFLLTLKVAAGLLALRVVALGIVDVSRGMMIIGLGGSFAITCLSLMAWRRVRMSATEGAAFRFRDMREVWKHEMGTAVVRSVSPFLYTYLLAKSSGGSQLLITYQLALHLAYILTLPQLAGTQIAIRDASQEESLGGAAHHKGLLEMEWFRWFFAVSLMPAQFLLVCGALFAPAIMRVFYGYAVPASHVGFLFIYFLACAIGQIGNIHLVTLRALKKNSVAMNNFFISEICVMVVLTGIAVSLGWGTPQVLGLIVLAYCTTYLILNATAVSRLQGAAVAA